MVVYNFNWGIQREDVDGAIEGHGHTNSQLDVNVWMLVIYFIMWIFMSK